MARPVAGRGAPAEEDPAELDQLAERVVVQVTNRRERRAAGLPQHLVLDLVADAGERPLVQQRDGDGHQDPGRVAEPTQGLVDVHRLLEQVDSRGVEADDDRARHLDDEAGPRGRPAPALAGAVAVP